MLRICVFSGCKGEGIVMQIAWGFMCYVQDIDGYASFDLWVHSLMMPWAQLKLLTYGHVTRLSYVA